MVLPPVLKAGMQSGSIMTVADILAQTCIEGRSFSSVTGAGSSKGNDVDNGKSASLSPSTCGALNPPEYNPMRTLQWSVAGLCIHGPYFLKAFGAIDKLFANRPMGFSTVMMKTATAQFLV